MDSEQKLKSICRRIGSCKKCRLWKERKRTVPGEGPAKARYMVVGQGPGAEEDKTGRPFIGRSGNLLTGFLEKAGLNREEVFITSAVKCFPTPPPNRKPKKDELSACLPFLEEQIALIGPEKIILVGEVSFGIFFPDRKLKDWRGKRMKNEKYPDKEFFATYHPAAALRFPGIWKKVIEGDFSKLGRRLRKK